MHAGGRAATLASVRSPIPARTLDGLRRRTRALLGRCQGFFCLAEVSTLAARASEQSVSSLLGLDGDTSDERPK